MKNLIITADDFGISKEVNDAVEDGHKNGVLTAASLMVAEPFAADAVERTKNMPRLGVGLHVALSRARPASNPNDIPALVDAKGWLRADLVGAGVRFFFLPEVRRQLAIEINAQFDAFARTGLTLDHVNAHNHLHLHPTVLSIILETGKEYGMRAIRLPKDRNAKGLGAAFLTPWLALMQARIAKNGVRHNDTLLGLDETGFLNSEAMTKLIDNLPDGTTELMCHPATGPWEGMDPMACGFHHDQEYAALIDASMRNAVTNSGANLIAYRDIP